MFSHNFFRSFQNRTSRLVKSGLVLMVAISLTGCFSIMGSGIDRGTGGSGEGSGALFLLDVVTLPVQVAALPVVAVSRVGSKSRREKQRALAAKRRQERNAAFQAIVDDPLLIAENDYLSKEPGSLQSVALQTYMQRHHVDETPPAVLEYLLGNTNPKTHIQAYYWLFRSSQIPVHALQQEWVRINAADFQKGWKARYRSVSFSTLMHNTNMPKILLAQALFDPDPEIREAARTGIRLQAQREQSVDR